MIITSNYLNRDNLTFSQVSDHGYCAIKCEVVSHDIIELAPPLGVRPLEWYAFIVSVGAMKNGKRGLFGGNLEQGSVPMGTINYWQ